MQITKITPAEKEVIGSYLRMAIWSLITIVAAKAFALAANKCLCLSKIWITVFEYLGYFCWGTALGSPGWTLMTWSQGETPHERLDLSLSMWLSLIGIFSFVLARDLIVI